MELVIFERTASSLSRRGIIIFWEKRAAVVKKSVYLSFLLKAGAKKRVIFPP